MNQAFPKPGDIFEGYRIRSELGSGGYSKVFEVTEMASGRRYALKIARPPDGAKLQTGRQRFEREAQIIKKLESPHTVRLFRAGTTDSDHAYMVLELVEGMHVGQLVNELGPIGPMVVAELLAQCLAGLAEAHRYGVIHRDIKPDNIMVVGENNDIIAKVIDFGVAKPGAEEHQKLTREGYVVGTPHFMAPEQMLTRPVSPASDIYSLGLVAYFLVTAKMPFTGDMVAAFEAHLKQDSFRIPSSISLGPELARIIDRMLEKDLSKRYATCEEVLRDLSEYAQPVDRRRQFRTTMQALPQLTEEDLATLPSVPHAPQVLEVPETTEAHENEPIKRGKGIRKRPPQKKWNPGQLEVDHSAAPRAGSVDRRRTDGYRPADWGWLALTALFAAMTLGILILRGM